MLRFAVLVLLCAALGTPVAAGPTIRRDEQTNAVVTESAFPVAVSESKPQTEPTAEEKPAAAADSKPTIAEAVPVKPAVSNDEVQPEVTTAAPIERPESPPTTTTVATSTTTEKHSGSSATPNVTTKRPRKTITFDQRQEGEYNIRADLENFVIVVVPSGSSSGATLLDLLNRSAQKKYAADHQHPHHHRKSSHKRKNNKAHGAQKKVAQPTPEVIVLDEEHGQRAAQLETEEFIEGRTPYKVDLSSSARSADGGNERVAMPKPGHAFRPFSVEQSGVAGSVASVVRFPAASGNYYPLASRAFPTLELIDTDRRWGLPSGRALPIGYDTNTVVAASSRATNHNNLTPGDGDPDAGGDVDDGERSLLLPAPLPSDRSDSVPYGRNGETSDDGGLLLVPAVLANPGTRYPSHDASISPDSLRYAPLRSDVDMTQLQLQPDDASEGILDLDLAHQDQGDELRLLGAQEQCGPDRKRDSYGVCQFVRP
ncbi:uncharacterized protein LOC131210066 [Anopheles bellator]|uniref:uncharacterized protein LOC131210066 n=1 Tax=Anopheles bellator TaxID=139047 RepID=UPI00264762AD|nr:uncharacterized protein LOC131210066 [Anopheles bellator]